MEVGEQARRAIGVPVDDGQPSGAIAQSDDGNSPRGPAGAQKGDILARERGARPLG